ncbi:MAG: tetratricopeptide repeat protein [Desulfobulbus sp.]|jgi:tetratricopeptide (TPR) repeat protein
MPILKLLSVTRFFYGMVAIALVATLCGCPDKSVPVVERQITPEEYDARSCAYFHFLWARRSELLLRFDEALEFYQRALDCDESAEYISEKIPLLQIRLGRFAEAANWLRDYLVTRPNNTGMRLLYAKVLLRQENSAEAMRQYQIVSDSNPDDPAIMLLLAEMYLDANLVDKAEPLVQMVLSRDERSYPGHMLMARIDRAQDRIDEAIAQYGLALEQNWSTEVAMELAEVFTRAERYDEAIRTYRTILEKDEADETARVGLVHVYLLKEDEAAALNELQRLKSFVNDPARVDLTIARIHARQQRYRQAIRMVERLLREEELSEGRYFLALLYAEENRYDQALEQLRRIPHGAPEFADAVLLRARLLHAEKKVGSARRLLEQEVREPLTRNADMFLLLAALYQEQGQGQQTRQILREGIVLFPEHVGLLYEYGLLQDEDGDLAGALATMERILVFDPENALALNFVGYTWADQNIKLDQAQEYLLKAVALQPENGYIRDSLGWLYYRRGKLEEAIREVEKAVSLLQEDGAVLEHLGDIYVAAKRPADALDAYQRALRQAADGPESKRLRDKIRSLTIKEPGP